jgi:serine/threonine protein phosphatase PrpC
LGAASRSYRNLRENGDAVALQQWEGHALAGVIDGLGHGQFAQRASQSARDYVLRHFDQPLDALFRGVGRACRATRGVVMALARFDFEREGVEIASVGNVGVHLMGNPQPTRIVVRRGVIGMSSSPSPVLTSHPWTAASMLIIHSDGVETHWHRSELEGLAGAATGLIARQLLQTYGRPDDDATVVVARNAN